jgi:outer membrane biogenesis lipoprotein LolB
MQKSFLIAIAILFSCSLYAQNSGLPDVVSKAFEQKFPKAKKVKWLNENIDDFQAEFALDSLTETATFTNKGEWIQTGINVPIPIINHLTALSIKKKYPKSKINKIVKIENVKKQVYYEIELKKGDELEYVNYDENGNEITSLK